MAIKDGDKLPAVNTTTLSHVIPTPPDGETIGVSPNDKIAFHGMPAVSQRTNAAQAAVVTTAATNTTPYGFTTLAQANALVTLVNEMRAALVEKGFIKGS